MKTSIKFDHKTIKAGEETTAYLLAKVTGPKGDPDREPLPLNLSVVIDRSGSMHGEKLRYVGSRRFEVSGGAQSPGSPQPGLLRPRRHD